MVIAYALKKAASAATLTLADSEEGVIRKLSLPAKAGPNRVVWNLANDYGARVLAGEYTIPLGAQVQKARPASLAPEDRPRRTGLR